MEPKPIDPLLSSAAPDATNNGSNAVVGGPDNPLGTRVVIPQQKETAGTMAQNIVGWPMCCLGTGIVVIGLPIVCYRYPILFRGPFRFVILSLSHLSRLSQMNSKEFSQSNMTYWIFFVALAGPICYFCGLFTVNGRWNDTFCPDTATAHQQSMQTVDTYRQGSTAMYTGIQHSQPMVTVSTPGQPQFQPATSVAQAMPPSYVEATMAKVKQEPT